LIVALGHGLLHEFSQPRIDGVVGIPLTQVDGAGFGRAA